jgi:hypothetical protein
VIIPVEASGFEIDEYTPSRTAEISISQSFNWTLLFYIFLSNMETRILLQAMSKTLNPTMKERKAFFLSSVFAEDREWEKSCVGYLEKAGI